MDYVVKVLFALLAVITAFAAPARAKIGKSEQKASEIVVIFRYDDYSSRSSTDAEMAIIGTFKKYRLPVTFGVVPFPTEGRFIDPAPQKLLALTEEKARILREAVQAEIVEAAQHGFSHHSTRDKYDGGWTEFDGVDYDTQLRKILRGKKYLESVVGGPVDVFIPPFESYDRNTLKALDAAGYKILASGRFGPVEADSGLVLLPSTCLLGRLKAVVTAARRFPEHRLLIVVLFHDSDFIEIDARRGWTTFAQFDELVGWVASQRDIKVLTHKLASQEISGLDAERFLSFQEFNYAFHWLPPFLHPLETGIYLPTARSRSLVASGRIMTAVFYVSFIAVVLALSFFVGRPIFRWPKSAAWIFSGIAVLAITVIILAFHYLMRDYKGPILIAGMSAGFVGAGLAFLQTAMDRRKR